MLKFFRPRNHKKEVLNVKDCEYYKCHTGINGNIAYYANVKFGYRLFVVELINLSDGRWCFHVERKDNMVIDSRLGNCFYKTPEEAHSAFINALAKKYRYVSTNL